MFFRKHSPAPQGVVGIFMDPRGFGLARVRPSADRRHVLDLCDFRSVDSEVDFPRALAAAVREHKLEGLPCVCVLSTDEYTLRLIDAPDVPDAELKDAARWLLKDSIDFSIEDAAIEVIRIPKRDEDQGYERIYAIALRKSRIERITALFKTSGLDLLAIDIDEMALRNAVYPFLASNGATAVLQLGSKASLLEIIRDGTLCMARSVSATLELLSDAGGAFDGSFGGFDGSGDGLFNDDLDLPADSFQNSEVDVVSERHQSGGIDSGAEPRAGSANLEHFLETLLLEVQRSLDYYESEFGRNPATKLLVVPSEEEIPSLIPYLSQNLHLDVEALELERGLEMPKQLPHSLQGRCIAAIGAALRSEELPQINFLDRGPDFNRQPFSARALLQQGGVFLTGLAVISGIALCQKQGHLSEIQKLEEHSQVTLETVNQLEAAAKKREQDANLVAEVEVLLAERNAKIQHLQSVESRQFQAGMGFSNYLEGLARNPVEGLWLEVIEISERGQGLLLSGVALQPYLVPRLLDALRKEPAFEGKEFKGFEMQSPTQDQVGIKFSLQTHPGK